jgi:hypothetical protein
MSISHNILTVPDTAVLETHLNALKPRWILFKDNLAHAAAIALKHPATSVMHRDWQQYQGDDDLIHRITPAAWLSTQRALGFLNVWRYCCNESGFNDTTLTWINEVIEINAKHPQPLKLVIGNWSAGTPNKEDWKRPQAIKFLRYLNQYREWLVCGLHDYFAAVPTSGMYGGYPSNANIASSPTDAPGSKGLNLIPMDKWPKDTRGITLFHCGRWRFMLQVCDELSIPYPRIVITEHGCDDLGDIKSWLETLEKTNGQGIRGWRTLERQWATWYGDGIDATYYHMLTYLDAAVYAGSPVEAQLIFCWGDSGGWPNFRVDNAPELLRRLEMYSGVIVNPPPHDDPPPPDELDTATLLALVEDLQGTLNTLREALK